MTITASELRSPGSCPGLSRWERHRDEDWYVFVDESFFMFFELVAAGGYFCHAAVGVPQREYDSLKEAIAPVFDDFARLTRKDVGEFKHTEFKRIDYRDRRALALRIRDVLVNHDAFVAGFYSPVRSFVLERVRSNLLGITDEIPEDHQALYDEAHRELVDEQKGPGQSGLLKRLILLPVIGPGNLLATLNCGFQVILDPREKKEDKVVRGAAADLIAATAKLEKEPFAELRNLAPHFRGIESGRISNDEVGLQLADLMVGEIAAFFKANEDLLSFGATRRLVTGTSTERMSTFTTVEGRLTKTGAVHKMPESLRRRFSRPDPRERTVLHFFRNLLASGMLSCYSVFGQPRDLLVFDGLIWDQRE